ncbi:hypothetical protein NE237_032113 [Protea cynaroides]|uniref:Leucine-rich repeat-containing N-terminal plant-type domain-containing protein n=1 Tax=Protea cynaroides TaxID=273540 RepID=A0A9Q0L3R6_9MAGN|nr:hypothetical protein NE237_032113 [Protea cynaroides]
MRIPEFSWLLLLYSVSILFAIDDVLVCGICLEDQSLSWNKSTDCCGWKGVTCDGDSGQVTSLNLSNEYISRGIDNSRSSLYNLRDLRSLNLFENYFDDSSMPIRSGLVELVNWTNLNLSNGFLRPSSH